MCQKINSVAFFLKAAKAEKYGNIIEGLALPFGEYSDAAHPAFKAGVLVDYGYTRPLLLEHDFTQRIGDVALVYEKDDGIYFSARITAGDIVELPDGVSIGGEYFLNTNGDIEALYIHEISLVANPAYSTTYRLVAEKNYNENSLNDIIMENFKIKSQNEAEVTALAQEVTQLIERVNAIEEKLMAIDTAIQELRDIVQSTLDASYSAVKSSEANIEAAKEEIAKHKEVLEASFAQQVEKTLEVLKTTIDLIKKR